MRRSGHRGTSSGRAHGNAAQYDERTGVNDATSTALDEMLGRMDRMQDQTAFPHGQVLTVGAFQPYAESTCVDLDISGMPSLPHRGATARVGANGHGFWSDPGHGHDYGCKRRDYADAPAFAAVALPSTGALDYDAIAAIVAGVLVNNPAFVAQLAAALETNPAFITALVNTLATNAALLTALSNALITNQDFINTIPGLVLDDPTFIADLVVLLSNNATLIAALSTTIAGNAAFITAVSNALTTDPAFLASLATSLSSDAAFISAVSNALTTNTAFLTALTTSLINDANFLSSITTALLGDAAFLASLSTLLVNNAAFITSVSTALVGNTTFVSNLATAIAGDTAFITSVGNQLAGDQTFLTDLGSALAGDTVFVTTLETQFLNSPTFIQGIVDALGPLSAGSIPEHTVFVSPEWTPAVAIPDAAHPFFNTPDSALAYINSIRIDPYENWGVVIYPGTYRLPNFVTDDEQNVPVERETRAKIYNLLMTMAGVRHVAKLLADEHAEMAKRILAALEQDTSVSSVIERLKAKHASEYGAYMGVGDDVGRLADDGSSFDSVAPLDSAPHFKFGDYLSSCDTIHQRPVSGRGLDHLTSRLVSYSKTKYWVRKLVNEWRVNLADKATFESVMSGKFATHLADALEAINRRLDVCRAEIQALQDAHYAKNKLVNPWAKPVGKKQPKAFIPPAVTIGANVQVTAAIPGSVDWDSDIVFASYPNASVDGSNTVISGIHFMNSLITYNAAQYNYGTLDIPQVIIDNCTAFLGANQLPNVNLQLTGPTALPTTVQTRPRFIVKNCPYFYCNNIQSTNFPGNLEVRFCNLLVAMNVDLDVAGLIFELSYNVGIGGNNLILRSRSTAAERNMSISVLACLGGFQQLPVSSTLDSIGMQVMNSVWDILPTGTNVTITLLNSYGQNIGGGTYTSGFWSMTNSRIQFVQQITFIGTTINVRNSIVDGTVFVQTTVAGVTPSFVNSYVTQITMGNASASPTLTSLLTVVNSLVDTITTTQAGATVAITSFSLQTSAVQALNVARDNCQVRCRNSSFGTVSYGVTGQTTSLTGVSITFTTCNVLGSILAVANTGGVFPVSCQLGANNSCVTSINTGTGANWVIEFNNTCGPQIISLILYTYLVGNTNSRVIFNDHNSVAENTTQGTSLTLSYANGAINTNASYTSLANSSFAVVNHSCNQVATTSTLASTLRVFQCNVNSFTLVGATGGLFDSQLNVNMTNTTVTTYGSTVPASTQQLSGCSLTGTTTILLTIGGFNCFNSRIANLVLSSTTITVQAPGCRFENCSLGVIVDNIRAQKRFYNCSIGPYTATPVPWVDPAEVFASVMEFDNCVVANVSLTSNLYYLFQNSTLATVSFTMPPFPAGILLNPGSLSLVMCRITTLFDTPPAPGIGLTQYFRFYMFGCQVDGSASFTTLPYASTIISAPTPAQSSTVQTFPYTRTDSAGPAIILRSRIGYLRIDTASINASPLPSSQFWSLTQCIIRAGNIAGTAAVPLTISRQTTLELWSSSLVVGANTTINTIATGGPANTY